MSTSIASIIPDTVTSLDPLLTAKQVAAILGVRAKRVYELGIPCVRLSERSIRWRPEAVSQWIREQEVTA